MALRHMLQGTTSNVEVAVAFQRRVVDLVGRLRVNQAVSADKVERTMRVLDSGQLDALMEDMVPVSQPTAPERFEDVKPFNHEAWKARHASR